jgi:hypothetical protein
MGTGTKRVLVVVKRSRSRKRQFGLAPAIAAAALGIGIVYLGFEIHSNYAFSLQSPIVIHLQSPLVIARRERNEYARQAQMDQHRPLTAYQQYTCAKFGDACRVALAIQRAENPAGKCEIYHYNTDGTLDWGYFQINTVHLKRPGVVLRNLLDCRANIDFAYELYAERHGFTPWSTYNSGKYREFLQP